jgi:cytochrome b involved in lipid metabolism
MASVNAKPVAPPAATSAAPLGKIGSKVSADKVYTWREYNEEEVGQHNTESDCWLIIHGKIYDVQTFLEDHPGQQLLY